MTSDCLVVMPLYLIHFLKLYIWCFQIVKEGEEPQQFLNHLSHLSLRVTDVGSCG